MLGLSLLFLSTLASRCLGVPVTDPNVEFAAEKEWLEKRAGTFAITGAQDGVTAPRLEIHTLFNNADQWNLYLLTMQNFQQMPSSSLLSYYQIAGIHGVPNIPWDGANQAANTGGAIGYCTHSTQLFPPWHRAYLALFEQAFLARVQTVIKQFPASQQGRWTNAAKNLRIPYWDWAATPPPQHVQLPSLISNKYVTVTTPTGSQSIINPLFRFDINPTPNQNTFIYDPFDHWAMTFRYPNSTDPVKVASQEQQAIDTFANQAQNLKSSIYNMFTQCKTYATFGTDQADNSDPACSTSLESIHGGVHNDMGGNNGHMTYLPFSGFDPTFWLHHANVDRYFALWQALYPNSYMTENSQTSQATFAYAQGTTVNGNFGMQPFHRDTSGTTWTPNAVKDWRIFKYDYPEFIGNDRSSATIRAKVNSLYGSTAGTARRKMMKRAAEAGADPAAVPEMDAPNSSLLTPQGKKKDWAANIVTSRFGLDDSYTVYIFLGNTKVATSHSNSHSYNDNNVAARGIQGTMSASSSSSTSATKSSTKSATSTSSSSTSTSTGNTNTNTNYTNPIDTTSGVPSDPSQWPFAASMVGSYGIFAMKDAMSTMPQGNNPLLVSGSVPLTTALVTAITSGELASLDNKDVVPFLRANLNWRVRKSDGTAVANADVPGLSVSIATANVTPAASPSDFPVYGEWKVINDATNGKHGGLEIGMAFDFFKSEPGSNGGAAKVNIDVSVGNGYGKGASS